ncbi:MAG TPA: alpha/beta hydrolase [Ramlibacter sp.]|nr:alpha/beta hydrolase [Ramlibacter sp.]
MSENPTAGLALGARVIPWPTTISEAARQVLANPSLALPTRLPPPADKAAWKTLVSQIDAAIVAAISPRLPTQGYTQETRTVAGVTTYVITPQGVAADDPHVFLDIHGGGFVLGRGEACRLMAIGMALRTGVRVVSVDYRMPPDHPYPAGLDDCLAVYRDLLETHRPADIIVGGVSAGGNLAAALTLRARDEGLPMPAAVVMMTPGSDITGAGDTMHTLRGIDSVLPSAMPEMMQLYAGDAPLDHPCVSPQYGDFKPGFPPTFLQSGTRDLLLSNTVRMHRKLRSAGIAAELHVFEAMPHGGFGGGTPDDLEVTTELRRFLAAHWK